MISRIASATLIGMEAFRVDVEVEISNGLPGWHMVGLPETMVKESKDRVSAAIRNSGYRIANRKITINFAPADQKKSGTGFDLPIALGLLETGGLVTTHRIRNYLVIGEISLNGDVRPIPGTLSMAIMARQLGLPGMIVPYDNGAEVAVIDGLDIIMVKHISDILRFIHDGIRLPRPEAPPPAPEAISIHDLSDVKGQALAKRALEIAAAGQHNMLMVGPPGTGKTMLAERLPTILPDLNLEQSLQTTQLYSIMGILPPQAPMMVTPPFRSPHHSTSQVGLIGGGSGIPRAGEISLAHNGVLFLDEFPEFQRHAINGLREPMESGVVSLTRATARVRYPARFVLIAAANPCRCGFLGHPIHSCTCSTHMLTNYASKLSGPIIDRIDLHMEVPSLTPDELTQSPKGESSASVKARVTQARLHQTRRYGSSLTNAHLSPAQTRDICLLKTPDMNLLHRTITKLGLSARSFDRILRVARTIADLENEADIQTHHLTEALQYRMLERRLPG